MKFKIFKLLTLALLTCLTVASSVNAKPGANAASEAKFLKAVPKNATLAQIKKLLPKGTKFGSPKWEPGGNSISFRGKISGEAKFLNARQKQFQSSQAYYGVSDGDRKKSPAAVRKLNATDPINEIVVLMDNGKNSSGNDAKQRIAAAQKVLGKPQEYSYISNADAFPMDGWYAKWEFNGSREIFCLNDYVDYKSRTSATMLRLRFCTYFFPFG